MNSKLKDAFNEFETELVQHLRTLDGKWSPGLEPKFTALKEQIALATVDHRHIDGAAHPGVMADCSYPKDMATLATDDGAERTNAGLRERLRGAIRESLAKSHYGSMDSAALDEIAFVAAFTAEMEIAATVIGGSGIDREKLITHLENNISPQQGLRKIPDIHKGTCANQILEAKIESNESLLMLVQRGDFDPQANDDTEFLDWFIKEEATIVEHQCKAADCGAQGKFWLVYPYGKKMDGGVVRHSQSGEFDTARAAIRAAMKGDK